MNTTQYDNQHFFILNFVNDAIIPYSNSGLLKKFFGGGWGLGVGVWGVGFYPFSGGQLPNFQGKSP